MINVVLSGMMGRMGSMIAQSFIQSDTVNLVGSTVAPGEVSRAKMVLRQIGAKEIPVSSEILEVLSQAGNVDVYLDFSIVSAAESNIPEVVQNKIATVIGVSGFPEDDFAWMEKLSNDNDVPILLVPNFSIGILLIKRMAQLARQYFPKTELIEAHHDMKRDSPSGTSLDLATSLAKIQPPAANRDVIDELDLGSRGLDVGDIKIHSIRLPGVIAEQTALFAGPGEVLSINHRTTSRESFLRGIYFAVENVKNLKGFNLGLETIMKL